jgi:hypothetical protein
MRLGNVLRLAMDRFRRETAIEKNVSQILRVARRCDPRIPADALAIMAVEMTFRPSLVRCLEYVMWGALSLGPSAFLRRVSLGPGQVQLQYWEAWGFIGGLRMTSERLRKVNDLAANLSVVTVYLTHYGLLGCEPRVLERAWTGGERKGFVKLLRCAQHLVSEGLHP